MTLQELKDEIDDICERYDNPDDIEVKVGIQPNYPLVASLSAISTEHKNGESDVVWFAIGDAEGYGVPREIWDGSDVYSE